MMLILKMDYEAAIGRLVSICVLSIILVILISFPPLHDKVDDFVSELANVYLINIVGHLCGMIFMLYITYEIIYICMYGFWDG